MNKQTGNNLQELANDSKAWVYTSSQKFTQNQVDEIMKYSEVFLSQWDSHGKMLKGTIQIIENRFIAIFADSEGETMCGTARDKSVKFIKELEEITGVTLMDRMLIAYKQNQDIKVLDFNTLRTKISGGEIEKSTLFYNGLITTKEEFMTNWEIPIEGSWI